MGTLAEIELDNIPEKYKSSKSLITEIAYDNIKAFLKQDYENGNLSEDAYSVLREIVDIVYQERVVTYYVEDKLSDFFQNMNFNINKVLIDSETKNNSLSFSSKKTNSD